MLKRLPVSFAGLLVLPPLQGPELELPTGVDDPVVLRSWIPLLNVIDSGCSVVCAFHHLPEHGGREPARYEALLVAHRAAILRAEFVCPERFDGTRIQRRVHGSDIGTSALHLTELCPTPSLPIRRGRERSSASQRLE